MYELWSITSNNGNPAGRPAGFIGHFTTNAQAIAYENEFEKILDKVKGSYNARKKTLLDELAKASEKLKKIFATRAECTHILMSPFIRMNTFRDLIETLCSNKSAAFIREFLGDTAKYDVLKKLYVVVAFYLELHRLFDYRLTRDEENTLTIGDVVCGKADKYKSDVLMKLWPDFKAVWRDIVNLVKPRECANAGEFEGALALIDDENAPFMGVLLTLFDEDGNIRSGEIYRAISDGVSKLQDTILDMRADSPNANELCFEDDKAKIDLPLESLTEYDASRLITGENYEGELELLIFTHMDINPKLQRDSVSYDYVGIARDIMCRYTSGRPHLRSGGEMSFRRVCNFAYEDVAGGVMDGNETEEQRIERNRRALIDSFRPLHGIESLRSYLDKAETMKLGAFNSESSSRKGTSWIKKAVSDKSRTSEQIQVECIQIAEVLAAVLRFIIANPKSQKLEAASNKTIGKLFEENIYGNPVPENIAFLNEWSCKGLLCISKTLLDTVSSKEYLFRDVVRNFTSSFDQSAKGVLEDYRKELVPNKDDTEEEAARKVANANAKIAMLEELFQILNSNRKLLKEINWSLMKTFNVAIREVLPDSRSSTKEETLLESVKAKSYRGFMMWFQKLISDIHWEAFKRSGSSVDSESQEEMGEKKRKATQKFYKEFVPPKPTILKIIRTGGVDRLEVPYNKTIAECIKNQGYDPEAYDIVDMITKKQVTEEERVTNYSSHKIILAKPKAR